MPRDLAREQLPNAVRAWAYWTGFGEPLSETLAASLGWTLARWDAGDDHLPAGLVHDLGYLLLRGRDFRFASARDLARWPDDERAARLAYEDRVLGRWAMDPTVTDAHVAIAGMSPEHRDAAVAHAVGLALAAPLRAADEVACGNPAHLRASLDALASAAPASYDAWAGRVGPEWAAWGREQLALCTGALPAGRLFRAEDLWEIAHLPELPSESARLALREVNGAAARVGAVSPSVALAVRRRAREVPVDANESDQYPAGGFDAISTRGTLENLVRSEVAYVGEGQAEPGGVDLFDVRFAEGELLYYTRDESPLLDARRDVTLVIDRPAELRFKQPALPAQTLVLVEGLALALQADLLRIFGLAGSRVRIVWRADTPEDREAAQEERTLLGFTLAAEIAHRRVELAEAASWAEVPDVGRFVFSPRAPDARVRCVAWVRVGDDAWTAGDMRFDLREGESAMRPLGDALLAMLARGEVRKGVRG